MGVVARPISSRHFNGKIVMERVSRMRYVTMAIVHTNFCDDALVNDAIKSGDWKVLIDSFTTTVEDLITMISGAYNIEDSIVDRIEFYYTTKIGGNNNTEKVILEDDNSAFNSKKIRVSDDKNGLT